MAVYISLLRGINVSGQKKIKMVDLKQLYEACSFTDVRTYIQSGNVVFNSTLSDKNELATMISKVIGQQYGFDVQVLVKSPKDIQRALDNNPFEHEKMYITFLFDTPEDIPYDEINKVKLPSEQFEIIEDCIYFYCPDGYGRSKFSNNFLERKLKVTMTSRNLRTTRKLLEMSSS